MIPEVSDNSKNKKEDYIQLGTMSDGRILATTKNAYSNLMLDKLGCTLKELVASNDSTPNDVKLSSNVTMPNNLMAQLLVKTSTNTDVDEVLVGEIIQKGTGIPYYGTLIGDMLVNPSTVDPRTFRKMAETDDDIGFALLFNVDSIVSSVGRYAHENREIQDAVRHTLYNLDQGFDKLVRDVCSGFIFGFSVMSLSWRYDSVLGGNTIGDAVPLPQSTIIFRVDSRGFIQEEGVGQFVYMAEFQNIANSLSEGWANLGAFPGYGNYGGYARENCAGDGYLGAGGYESYAGEGSSFASNGDLQYPFRLPYYTNVGLVWLPRKSVMIYSNYGVASQMSPYGKSVLRIVYNLWLQKLAIQQIRTYALDKRAVPLLVFYCESRVASAAQDPQTGTPYNTPMTVLETTKAELQDVSSVGAIFLPKEAVQVESLPIEGDIDMLDSIEQKLRSAISKALGVPAGLSSSDESSYASATRQGMTNSLMVGARRREVLNTIIKDFVKPVIIQLFPQSVHQNKWGRFENELLTLDEKIKNTTLATEQTGAGIASIDRLTDLNHMRESGGLEPLQESEHQEYLTHVKEQLRQGRSKDKRDIEDSTSDNYTHDKERQ